MVVDKEKVLHLALLLSDVAEGAGLLLDALKLVESSLDDIANTLRAEASEVNCEIS